MQVTPPSGSYHPLAQPVSIVDRTFDPINQVVRGTVSGIAGIPATGVTGVAVSATVIQRGIGARVSVYGCHENVPAAGVTVTAANSVIRGSASEPTSVSRGHV